MTADPDTAPFVLIYDGDCPICRSFATAIALRERFGELLLVDARTEPDHPACHRARAESLDLDAGLVIFAEGKSYHGRDAARFLAEYGAPACPLTRLARLAARSRLLSGCGYFCLRGLRNLLLALRGIGKLRNLEAPGEPFGKALFSPADWDRLPPVFVRHYAARAHSADSFRVTGRLDVTCAGPVAFLAPLLRMAVGIPARTETNMPVSVEFRSDRGKGDFHLVRRFDFRRGGPHIFHSRMRRLKDGDVVEIMRLGLFWRCRFRWDGQRVLLQHRGYGIRLLGLMLPLPLELLLGPNNAYELAIDERRFEMATAMTHPFWGEVFGYKGRFEFAEEA